MDSFPSIPKTRKNIRDFKKNKFASAVGKIRRKKFSKQLYTPKAQNGNSRATFELHFVKPRIRVVSFLNGLPTERPRYNYDYINDEIDFSFKKRSNNDTEVDMMHDSLSLFLFLTIFFAMVSYALTKMFPTKFCTSLFQFSKRSIIASNKRAKDKYEDACNHESKVDEMSMENMSLLFEEENMEKDIESLFINDENEKLLKRSSSINAISEMKKGKNCRFAFDSTKLILNPAQEAKSPELDLEFVDFPESMLNDMLKVSSKIPNDSAHVALKEDIQKKDKVNINVKPRACFNKTKKSESIASYIGLGSKEVVFPNAYKQIVHKVLMTPGDPYKPVQFFKSYFGEKEAIVESMEE